MEERLQKVLARAGFASRRGAEALMQEGRVTVNGAVVKEPGTKADAARDDIRVDGVRVRAAGEPVYIVLHKPRGVVTTRRDPAGRPTVMDLVPGVAGLFPVGRLDLTTEGLILLTNDGAFAERVAHPRYEVPRVYHAKVRGVPDARTLARLRKGVRIKDDVLAADRVRLVEVDRNSWVEVTLHEGKQHEVKRLLEAVGHPVSKLRRVAFGPVTLKSLAPGEFRALSPAEVSGLLRGEESSAIPARRRGRRSRPESSRRAGAREDHRRGDGRRGAEPAKTGPLRAGTGKPTTRTASPRKTGARRPATGTTSPRKAGARRPASVTASTRKTAAWKATAGTVSGRTARTRKPTTRKPTTRKDGSQHSQEKGARGRTTGRRGSGAKRPPAPAHRPSARRGSTSTTKRGTGKRTASNRRGRK